MTDIQRAMLEKLGLKEEDFKAAQLTETEKLQIRTNALEEAIMMITLGGM